MSGLTSTIEQCVVDHSLTGAIVQRSSPGNAEKGLSLTVADNPKGYHHNMGVRVPQSTLALWTPASREETLCSLWCVVSAIEISDDPYCKYKGAGRSPSPL